MTAVHTAIGDAIEAAITGLPDVGKVIRGAVLPVDVMASSDSATVGIEFGALDPEDKTGQSYAGAWDGLLEVNLDVYWVGPPAVWETRIFEASTAVWRAVMQMTLPARALEVQALGHDRLERNTDGDNQHVVLRNRYAFRVRYSLTDPEA